MISLECIPDRLAEMISKELTIPATGIGCGLYTDGQSLNLYDLLGLFERFTPKFVKKYAGLSQVIMQAIEQFREEVESGVFPGPEHTFHIKEEVLNDLLEN